MIRERVSTQGITRPLEHEEELPAFRLSSQLIGIIPESVLKRYTAAKHAADLKFASMIKGIDTVGILQYNPIQSAISRNLIGQIFGTE